ncbi:MAG TPA: FAD-dependent monooxygenase [Actinomycetota bacterium]|nr:FAD-dependent monooxygenase [Actinomycetota bacterium]
MYDVIVVGARCAGSPLAMQLARKGDRVLVVDRATFPSDTMSTHFIQLPGMARLKRWGLLDRVLATGCPLVTHSITDEAGNKGEIEIPLVEGVPGLISPRRKILDTILVEAAAEAGAEIREGVSVDGLLFEGDRVVGIEGHTDAGAFSEKARFVIGADGKNSVVAREVAAPVEHDFGKLTGGYYSYFSGLDCPSVELFIYPGAAVVMFPTHDGLTTVAFVRPANTFKDMKRDIEGSFFSVMDQVGIGNRVRAATREEPYIGTGDVPNFIRKAHGPGWALAGDAAYHKDPTPADGISDAFRAADLLSGALDEILNGVDEEKALSSYQTAHDAIGLPLLEKTAALSDTEGDPQERVQAFFEIRLMVHTEAEQVTAAA